MCTRLQSYFYSAYTCSSATFPTHGVRYTKVCGWSKDYNYDRNNCPCALPYPGPASPPFVGENYFCESGNTGLNEDQWQLNDPLWDSQGCTSGSTCCNRGEPWFTTTLNQETIDDIEMRLYSNQYGTSENIGVEQLEIFVYWRQRHFQKIQQYYSSFCSIAHTCMCFHIQIV